MQFKERKLIMKIKLDMGAYAPEKAHEQDAGFDLRTREPIFIPAGESAITDTGVHIQLPPHRCGLLVSKSGLNMKGITTTGLIDEGYTGAIKVKIYNHSREDYLFEAGDKITQLLIIQAYSPRIDIVNELENTERGDNGFGSSGK